MIPWFSQRGSGPHYGRIVHVPSYLKYRYKQNGELLHERRLPITPRHMVDWFGPAKACSLMAVEVIRGYHLGEEDDPERRERLKKKARRYLYFDWRGTPVWAVGMLLRSMGFKVRHSMVLDFKKMRKELDQNRPFILNLAWGDYPLHTITVTGYQLWQVGKRKVPVLIVADGWSREDRYIDFKALTTIGYGTLATVIYGKPNGIKS